MNELREQEENGKLRAENGKLNREIKKSAKKDKATWTKKLAQEAEEASATNNMRELYKITKILTSKSYNPYKPLYDKQKQLITTPEEQVKRWQEYYTELFEEEDMETEAASIEDNEERYELLNIITENPSREEAKEAIKHMRNNNWPGADEIPAEIWKADPVSTIELLIPLIEDIWTNKEIPKEWKNEIIVKLPKRGDIKECKNGRGVTTANKILAHIINQRIKQKIDNTLRQEQAGFRRGRSCIDQIATMRMIIEETIERNANLILVFVDFEKAFDRIKRGTMWKILKQKGISEKMISLIKMMYRNATCQVEHHGYLTNKIKIKKGVKQGPLHNKKLADLDYADDICLMSSNEKDIKRMLGKLETVLMKTGKTLTQEKLLLNQRKIKEVNEFCYLGSVMSMEGGTEEDIKQRIWKAQGAFGTPKNIWSSPPITQNTKLRKQQQRIQIFVNKMSTQNTENILAKKD
ncbi:uncharacterized protein LOC135123778 [Zophobas morio]|uniref:uncharacterized protein LOC135123778 n=1 Tax=Zophobas morio TaxID=2755281 RepID=UPI00308289D1